jgi:hypothetical protein
MAWASAFTIRAQRRALTTKEVAVSTDDVRSNDATESASFASVIVKLEVVVIPVSDVDCAREFYSRLGWRLDAHRAAGNSFHGL